MAFGSPIPPPEGTKREISVGVSKVSSSWCVGLEGLTLELCHAPSLPRRGLMVRGEVGLSARPVYQPVSLRPTPGMWCSVCRGLVPLRMQQDSTQKTRFPLWWPRPAPSPPCPPFALCSSHEGGGRGCLDCESYATAKTRRSWQGVSCRWCNGVMPLIDTGARRIW